MGLPRPLEGMPIIGWLKALVIEETRAHLIVLGNGPVPAKRERHADCDEKLSLVVRVRLKS
jgi:hypothetical protein